VVFNGVGTIGRTIDSTLAQDYADVETVVIDGQVERRHAGRSSTGMPMRSIALSPNPTTASYDAMNKRSGQGRPVSSSSS
jgi:hypothetical protein